MTNEIIKERDHKGRFVSSYKPEYDQLVIDHLANGYSIESFAGSIGVDRSTPYAWAGLHESFKEAVEVGLAKSQKYWESVGKLGMIGKVPGFNATVWIFSMKNKFGWRDRHEIKSLRPEDEFAEVSHRKIMDYIEGKKF